MSVQGDGTYKDLGNVMYGKIEINKENFKDDGNISLFNKNKDFIEDNIDKENIKLYAIGNLTNTSAVYNNKKFKNEYPYKDSILTYAPLEKFMFLGYPYPYTDSQVPTIIYKKVQLYRTVPTVIAKAFRNVFNPIEVPTQNPDPEKQPGGKRRGKRGTRMQTKKNKQNKKKGRGASGGKRNKSSHKYNQTGFRVQKGEQTGFHPKYLYRN